MAKLNRRQESECSYQSSKRNCVVKLELMEVNRATVDERETLEVTSEGLGPRRIKLPRVIMMRPTTIPTSYYLQLP